MCLRVMNLNRTEIYARYYYVNKILSYINFIINYKLAKVTLK